MLIGVEGALERGRQNAEGLMRDHVVVTRAVEARDKDGFDVTTHESVWEGPCRVQTYEPESVLYVSAGRPVETQEYRLHVPVDSGPFLMGDIATVVGYPYPFRIDGLMQKTFATAQRLKITSIANPPTT